MAVANSSLTNQLLSKLSDEGIPLEKKLEVCRVVFTSTCVPIMQKEDCVLDYLGSCLKNEAYTDQRAPLLECLHQCLSSSRMKEFKGNLRPGVVVGVLQALGNFEAEEYEVASQCLICLLSTTFFQRWLSCDVSGLCKLLGSFFNRATSKSYADCIKVLSLFLYINRISLLKEDLRSHFVNETLIPLARAHSVVQDDEYHSFRTKAVVCIAKILLHDASFVNNFIIIMQLHSTEDLDTTESKDVKDFCARIKKLPSSSSFEVVSSTYTLFLEAVALKDPKVENPEALFRVFMLLCKPLGIRVDKLVSISISPVKRWTHEETFKLIGNMIDVLDQSNIPLSVDFSDFTSHTWMISLVIGMTNINLTNLTPELLTMVRKAFHFNNLIIEPCIRVVSNIILRNKSDEIKPHYVELMKTVYEGASKAQRFSKILTLFLPQIRDVLIAFSQEVSIEDTFPDPVRKSLSNTISSLAHTQVLPIFKSFLFHLEHNCLKYLESSSMDSVVVTNFEIISVMFVELFNVVQIADHTTPDVVKAKFNNLLDDMKTLLAKFGEIFADCHHDELLKTYLDLCHSYGAVKLMIEEYEGCPLKKIAQSDFDPRNLSFAHPYLDADTWKMIVSKIIDHDDCLAKPVLYKLMVQKIEAVSQIEEGSEGPGTQVARLLLDIADTSWLWNEIVGLSSLFEATELVKLIRRLVNNAGNNQSPWKPVVSNELFKEDRRLVLATATRLLHKASKRLNDTEGTVSFDIVSYLHHEILLEYELSLLITEDVELEEQIQNGINEMVSILEQVLLTKQPVVKAKVVPDKSFFEVLELLPLHHTSVLSQICIFQSIIALLYDLPKNQEADNILFDILFRIVTAVKKSGNKLFGGLNPGILLRFLSERSKEYPLQGRFLQKICALAIPETSSGKQLLEAVSEPTKEDIWLTTLVIRTLMQNQKKVSDEEIEEKPLNRDKCIARLVSLCVPILTAEKPTLTLLNDYSVILKRCFVQENSPHLDSLLPKLPNYVEIAITNYKTGMDLISLLIANKSYVEPFVPSSLILDTWNHFLFHSEEPPKENILHLVLTKSSYVEFETMISKAYNEVERLVGQWNEQAFNKIVSIWSSIITCGLGDEKSRCRQERCLQLVIQPFLEVITLWSTSNNGVGPILEFFTNLASSTWVVLKKEVLDVILLVLGSIPLPSDDHRLLLANLNLGVELFFGLYLFRTNVVLDRLPTLLQRFRLYLNTLASCAHPDNSSSIIRETTACAEKIERVAKTMSKRQRDFTRLAPYLVADLINLFEKHQIHADVKLVYTNITNVFLSLCDNHGITYLEAVLSPALFKSIYDNYKKYYRYVGKI